MAEGTESLSGSNHRLLLAIGSLGNSLAVVVFLFSFAKLVVSATRRRS